MNSIYNSDSVDSAISDLHAWRRELSDQFAGDVRAMVEDAMRRQEQSGHRIIRRRELTNKPMHPSSGGTVPHNSETSPAAK